MGSRYPAPGSLTEAHWTTDGEEETGLAAVLATSRHQHALTEEQGLALLRERYGPGTTIERVATWRSITAAQVRAGEAPPETEDWAESGAGSAWVRVAYPVIAWEVRTDG